MARRESFWRTDTPQRWAVYAALAASVLVFWRPTLDDFTLPKVTAVVVLVIIGVAAAIIRGILLARLQVARTPFLVVVGIFFAMAIATAFWTVDPTATWFGQYGRYLGLVPYAGYIGLGVLAVHTVRTRNDVVTVLRTLLVAGSVAAVYTIIQWMGLDWWQWEEGTRPVFGTLGNSNFAAAMLGITAAAAAWQLAEDEPPAGAGSWRIFAGLTLALCVAGIVATATTQGLLVLISGVGLILVLVVAERLPAFDRLVFASPGRLGAVAGALFGAALIVALAFRDRLAAAVETSAFRERELLYEAALSMIRDRPLTGVGFDAYGSVFTRYRPAEHATSFGFAIADEPHSVPLGMFTDGGVLLGLAYLAVLAYVGWRLVVGLASTSGSERRLVGGLGAVWLGYQLQATVSIDEPALVATHWATAGALVGYLEQPGSAMLALPWGRGKKRRPPRKLPAVASAVVVVVVLGAAAAAWLALRPFRADVLAAEAEAIGRFAVERGNEEALAASVDRFDEVERLAPWIAQYPFRESLILNEAERDTAALAALEEAARENPGNPTYWLNVGRVADFLGLDAVARDAFLEAVETDPRHPEVLVAAAEFFLGAGQHDHAAQLIEHALAIEPGNSPARALQEQLN